MTLLPALPDQGVAEGSGRREAAEAAGRRLAADARSSLPAGTDNPVEAMARAAVPRLRELGVVAEIVRSRGDCLVVRSVASDPFAVGDGCALVGAWLGALPREASGLAATLAESTCATRGHRMCMHTLMWRPAAEGASQDQPAPAGLPVTAPPAPDWPVPPALLTPEPLASPDQPVRPDASRAGDLLPAADPLPAGTPLSEPSPDAASPLPILAASGLAPAVPPQPPATPEGWTPVAPDRVAPERVAPDRVAPERVAPDRVAPERVAPSGVLPTATVTSGTATTGHGVTAYGALAAGDLTRGPREVGDPRERLASTPAPAPGAPVARPQVSFAMRGASFGRAPWVRRRAWLLVVGLLAGVLGGVLASAEGGASYAATAVLEVQSSAATTAVASADGAEELAVTYAALVPTDEALLDRVASDLGTPVSTVGGALSVEAVAGTALIDVRYSSANQAAAREGADAVAGLLTSAVPPGRAITPGSVSLVSSAGEATRQGSLHHYGLPIGILLGLLVGAAAALVAERTDRRVDDVEGLSAAAGCSATAEPGGISPAELAAALSPAGDRPVVFVPLGAQEEPASAALGMRVAQAWHDRPTAAGRNGAARGPGSHGAARGPGSHGAARGPGSHGAAAPVVTVGAPFSSSSRSPQPLAAPHGSTVLVVAAGQRACAVQEAADRLRLVNQGPTWAVLVPRAGRAVPDGHGT